MAPRAASAARSLTPLAVLVPILATIAGGAWAFTTWPPLALLAIVGGFMLTALAGSRTYGTRPSLVAGASTCLAALVAFPLWYALSINTSVCGKIVDDAWAWLPYTVGALVFLAVGSHGFHTDRARSIAPMAFLFGVVAMFTLTAIVPGAHGICET